MSEALRDNTGKPKLSELHWFGPGLVHLALHCERGRLKYPDVKLYGGQGSKEFDAGPYHELALVEQGELVLVPNWTLGGKPDAEYLDAIERHAGCHVRGELYSPDMGTLHLIAIAWNALACVANNYGHLAPAIDPTEGPMVELLGLTT